MGNQIPHLVGKGGGAPFDLGGFQEMAAGFVEDHAAKAVGEHRRHLAGFHVVGIEHGCGTGAHFLGRAIRIPLAQIVRASGGAVAAAQAGPVVPIGGQHVEAEGLVQTNVAGKGAITGSD